MKKIVLILFTIYHSAVVFAQTDIGMNFSNTLWQAQSMNPAFVPSSKIVVALPSLAGGIYNTLGGVSVQNGKTQFNNYTASRNTISGEKDVSYIGVGFRVGEKGFFSLTQNLHETLSLSGSTELFQTIVQGNAQFIGKKIDVAPLLNFKIYNEIGLSFAYGLNEKINVGGKLKYLSGFGAAQTQSASQLSLLTNSDIYQLQFTSDYTLQASANFSAKTLGNLDTFPLPSLKSISQTAKTDGQGIGLDLGATYKINDKISVNASIINLLGSIKWKNSNSYNSNGSFAINGLDIVRLVKDSTLKIKAPNLDTLAKEMNFKKTATPFSTTLPRYIYFSAGYKITNALTANVLAQLSSVGRCFALNGTYRLNDWAEAGLTYSLRNGSRSDIGTNIVLKGGPVQVFFIADNLFALQKPLNVYNANLRGGINLVFGKRNESK